MPSDDPTVGETVVEPSDRSHLRDQLEQFAGVESVTQESDGTLRAVFSPSTAVAVDTDGHVTAGMPLHAFDAPADQFRFDHDTGELHVTADDGAVSYTFRRP